jgi:hypothetical protein
MKLRPGANKNRHNKFIADSNSQHIVANKPFIVLQFFCSESQGSPRGGGAEQIKNDTAMKAERREGTFACFYRRK